MIPYRWSVWVTAAREQFTDSAISTGLAGVVVVSVRIASALLPGLGLRMGVFVVCLALVAMFALYFSGRFVRPVSVLGCVSPFG